MRWCGQLPAPTRSTLCPGNERRAGYPAISAPASLATCGRLSVSLSGIPSQDGLNVYSQGQCTGIQQKLEFIYCFSALFLEIQVFPCTIQACTGVYLVHHARPVYQAPFGEFHASSSFGLCCFGLCLVPSCGSRFQPGGINMRNVLRSGEVFHYFANKVQPSGRCGNTSFALPNAYSYAAVIGKHFAQGVALSNTKYSVTTSSHQSDLRQACRHLTKVYVPDPSDLRTSYAQVQINVANLLKKASTAKAKKESYLGDALRQVADFNIFAEWCDSALRIESPVSDSDALKQIAIAVKAENAKRNAAKRERARLDAMDNAEKLALWRTGENVYLPYNFAIALRVIGGDVQTTKGARIPVVECPLIWAMVNRKKAWEPRNPIGVYQLTKIRDDGSIVVGCHDIAFSELQYIAGVLGLSEKVAA